MQLGSHMAVLVPWLHSVRVPRALWCLLVLVCAWLPARARAADSGQTHAPPIIMDSSRIPGITLGKKLDYVEDRSGTWTIDDVTSPQVRGSFRPARDDVPSFGLTTSTYWVRFTVDNRTREHQPWLLELAYPPIDDLRLFVPMEHGGYEHRRAGDQLPFAQREVEYRTFLFRLSEPPGARTYY